MKKETLLSLLLAAVCILGLGGLTAYLALSSPDKDLDLSVLETETGEYGVFRVAEEAEENDAAEASAKTQQEDPFLIWVGDSRTLGMGDAMENDNLYIGAAGEGYAWFSQSGLSLMEEAIEEHPGTPVIFNFGVNDYDSMEDYLTLYKEILARYPETPFYFLSVNPIDPAQCENITNKEIADFNQHLKTEFSDAYIDSYTYLMVQEVVPFDGVHYTPEEYRMIYEYAVEQIEKRDSP